MMTVKPLNADDIPLPNAFTVKLPGDKFSLITIKALQETQSQSSGISCTEGQGVP